MKLTHQPGVWLRQFFETYSSAKDQCVVTSIILGASKNQWGFLYDNHHHPHLKNVFKAKSMSDTLFDIIWQTCEQLFQNRNWNLAISCQFHCEIAFLGISPISPGQDLQKSENIFACQTEMRQKELEGPKNVSVIFSTLASWNGF